METGCGLAVSKAPSTTESISVPYVFEDDFSGPREQLLTDFTVPDCFTPDVFEQHVELRGPMPRYRWFLCGLSGSGTALHVDPGGTAAWNALLAGKKRWWFFPPCQEARFKDAIGVACRSPLAWWHKYAEADGGERLAALGMVEVVQESERPEIRITRSRFLRRS